jgi:WXG100 family type VII secretion target
MRFNPDQIAAVAADILRQHNTLSQNLAQIRQRSDSLRASWQSDSRGDNYYREFEALDRQGEEMAARLLDFGNRLLTVAGRYEVGEKDVKREVQTTSTGNVFRY